MLRLGCKRVQMLPSDGKEPPARRAGERGDGGVNVGHPLPVVAFSRHPGGAFQCQKGRAGHGTCGDGIAAHLGCEGVRGVNHMADRFGFEVGAKTLNSAKAAHPHRDRLVQRRVGPARVRIDALKPRLGNRTRQKARLRGAAEKKDACHG